MRLVALGLAGGLIFAPIANAQLRETSDAYGPFSGATYIEDAQSNIVMTRQREMRRNGYGIDFRGTRSANQSWEVEYFCEPDTVLLVGEPGRGARSYYLPYLMWADDLYLTPTFASAAAQCTPSMGTYASELPHDIAILSPAADILEFHVLQEGVGFIQTVVQIRNRASSPQRMTYIYQDGAFMWFPDGDQRNVESIRIVASLAARQMYINTVSAGPTPVRSWQFVGTFNREHGVVAGIVTTDQTDIAGISGNYIGVQQVERGGVPYFAPRVDPVIPEGGGANVRDETYDIRFIALDFGTLQPGEQRQRYFHRIMTVLPPAERNENGIAAWVEQMVQRIQAPSVSP